MNKYISKCAVEIQGIESAKQIWKYIGKYSKPKHLVNKRFVFTQGEINIQTLDCEYDRMSHIDCNAYTPNGTEEEAVKLFLELVQMNNDAHTLWVSMEQPIDKADGSHDIVVSYHKDWTSSNELIEAACEGRITELSPRRFALAFKDGRVEL